MADLVKKIRTESGDLEIDYNALANKPAYAAGATTGGAAVSANKLNTDAGSTTQPVYFKAGVPVATTYKLNATVPPDAKFTDTIATLSSLGITATASELNILDGVTATAAELNVLDGVTVSATQINRLKGVTSNVQTQLDGKFSSSGGTLTGNLTFNTGNYVPFIELFAYDNKVCSKICKNAGASGDYGLQLRDYADGGMASNSSTVLMLSDHKTSIADKIQLIVQTDGANKYYKLYGEHNKPSPSDLGLSVKSSLDITQSYFGALHAIRYGVVKRLRAVNPAKTMNAGTAYTICTLDEAYWPKESTYSAYVCMNATTSGASYGFIEISTAGVVKFTPYVALSASGTLIIDVTYI